MAEYIEDGVRELHDSQSESQVQLLVGPANGLDELSREIANIGGEVIDQVGRRTVRAEIAKSAVNELCSLESVAIVELDEADVRLQDDPNFRHRTSSKM